MKKIKLLASVTLTTIFATSAVLAWTNLWIVSDSDTLTSTLWNATVWRINEIATKVTENSTPPVFSASLSATQSPITETLLTAWSEQTDNKNAFTSWVYTVPKEWYYKINYEWLFKNNWVTTYYWYIALYINNVLKAKWNSSLWTTMVNGPLVWINRIYYLNVWATIDLRWYVNNSSALIYSDTHSHFTIEYIWE